MLVSWRLNAIRDKSFDGGHYMISEGSQFGVFVGALMLRGESYNGDEDYWRRT